MNRIIVEKPDYPSADSYRSCAELLGCDVAALLAVGAVEAGPQGAFLPDGMPVVLFEPHRFDALTGGRFRGVRAPEIPGEPGVLSRQRWLPGTYGPPSLQHARLAAAAELDRAAALKAASWGLFQIMGENHGRAGHKTLQSFINAAYRSADDHLAMFANFIRSDARLLTAIQRHDWTKFARYYNGPQFKRNRYDDKLAAEYAKFATA